MVEFSETDALPPIPSSPSHEGRARHEQWHRKAKCVIKTQDGFVMRIWGE